MKQLLKLIAVMLENLPEMSPEKIQQWIEAPQAIKDGLNKMFSQIPLKIWKTIKLVAFKSADQCLKALEAAGCQVGDWARDLIKNKIDFTKSVEEDVKLIKRTVAELGFAKGATLRQILERGLEVGLEECRPTDGPNARIAYTDQRLGEVVWMAMRPITDSHGYSDIFYLGRNDGGLFLRAYYYDLDDFFDADCVFVFRSRFRK